MDGDVSLLSGGWKIRVALARHLPGTDAMLLDDQQPSRPQPDLAGGLPQDMTALLMTCATVIHEPHHQLDREIDGGSLITVRAADFYEAAGAGRETRRHSSSASRRAGQEMKFIGASRRAPRTPPRSETG
jgi:hypothetical protein